MLIGDVVGSRIASDRRALHRALTRALSEVAEYAVEKRSFVPINAMPQRVINAFLAAEDKNFYSHSGVDPLGVLRAAAAIRG